MYVQTRSFNNLKKIMIEFVEIKIIIEINK